MYADLPAGARATSSGDSPSAEALTQSAKSMTFTCRVLATIMTFSNDRSQCATSLACIKEITAHKRTARARDEFMKMSQQLINSDRSTRAYSNGIWYAEHAFHQTGAAVHV